MLFGDFMKWSLQQLNKYKNQDFRFETTFDFTEEIKNIDDILGISETIVKGKLTVLDFDKFRFDLNIKCTLILEDARTLDPIDYLINLDVVETYTVEDNGDLDAIIIESNTVDLRPVVWEHILLHKPIRFVKEETQVN